mmetsp:Transcript_27879/g.65513  ORF Transcript_27879/g.65513 Transcript_27879/m.65513 type:complete len:86 (+) Transcript_27879:168-425(+)
MKPRMDPSFVQVELDSNMVDGGDWNIAFALGRESDGQRKFREQTSMCLPGRSPCGFPPKTTWTAVMDGWKANHSMSQKVNLPRLQ